MKFLTLPAPTEKERNRIYEINLYILIKNLEKRSADIQQQLYALAMLADITPTELIMVTNKLLEPINEPTRIELSVALAYLTIPVREITTNFIHHKTYYKNIYNYFDEESTIPKIYNKLTPEEDLIIIKLLSYIKNNFDIYDIARRGITYG